MAGEEFIAEKEAAASLAQPLQYKLGPSDSASERIPSGRRPPPPFRNNIFICSFPDCDATFNKGWKLDAHLCGHTGERPFVCDYEGCGKGFTRDFHLKRHFLTHTGEKPFECPADGCGKKFTTKSNLNKHFVRSHEQRKYTCDFEKCGKSFKKHQQLKIHLSQHTGEEPFRCINEECGMRFSTPNHLRRHEKTHEGYACKKGRCSFIGKTWSELLKHIKQDHAEPVICSVCSKVFRRKDHLKCHQKIHATERQVFKCPREGCERTYTTMFNLQTHILSFHEEKKQFSCEHPGCGKFFAMKQSLIRHAVMHDPEKQKLKAKAKKSRPKRSLASRLSGYIPPKAKQGKASSRDEIFSVPPVNTMLPTVETLSLG
uniref:Transcription factor IIIA n=1 Tax=Salvator merianae TaxID=96440 RepID=A0A8D0C409_SALMN